MSFNDNNNYNYHNCVQQKTPIFTCAHCKKRQMKNRYRCKVCGKKVCKYCLTTFNESTVCSVERLLEKKPKPKEIVSILKVVIEGIANDPILRPSHLENFLSLMSFLGVEYLNNDYYNCFYNKPVVEARDISDKILRQLSYPSYDVFSHLDDWMSKKKGFFDRLSALKVLFELSYNETNKSKIMRNHTRVMCSLLLSNEERNQNHPSPEEVQLAIYIFKILNKICSDDQQRMLFIATGDFERVAIFLRQSKKVSMKENPYKVKQNRELYHCMMRKGGKFITAYFSSFYEKDMKITQILCSTFCLDILIDYVSKEGIDFNLSPLISPKDICRDDETLIYESPVPRGPTVKKCKWMDRDVAIKTFDTTAVSFNFKNFLKEITLMTLIKHPNACPYYGAYIPGEQEWQAIDQEHSAPEVFLIMPYFKNGSLADYLDQQLKKLTTSSELTPVLDVHTLTKLAIDGSKCLQHLHSRTIIHRDVKTSNFLLDDDWNLLVCDFGISRVMEDHQPAKYTYNGTELWMAPEIYSLQYDFKVDSYSFALVLWSMMTGKPPFTRYEQHSMALVKDIDDGKREPIPKYAHPYLVDLISTCWKTDPKERYDFDQILNILYKLRDWANPLGDITDADILRKIQSHLEDEKDRTRLGYVNRRFYHFLVLKQDDYDPNTLIIEKPKQEETISSPDESEEVPSSNDEPSD